MISGVTLSASIEGQNCLMNIEISVEAKHELEKYEWESVSESLDKINSIAATSDMNPLNLWREAEKIVVKRSQSIMTQRPTRKNRWMRLIYLVLGVLPVELLILGMWFGSSGEGSGRQNAILIMVALTLLVVAVVPGASILKNNLEGSTLDFEKQVLRVVAVSWASFLSLAVTMFDEVEGGKIYYFAFVLAIAVYSIGAALWVVVQHKILELDGYRRKHEVLMMVGAMLVAQQAKAA